MMPMEDGHSYDSAHKVEVGQMIGIDARIGVNLKRVNVLPRVQEQSVVGVQHFVGEQVEPLPRHAPVVESVLSLELDHQSLAEILRSHLNNLAVRLFKDFLATHFKSAVSGCGLQCGKFSSQDFDFSY